MSTRRETRIIHKVIDGEASKSESRILKEKIKKDPAVREEFEGLKAVAKLSRALDKKPVPAPKLKERVLRGIRQESR